MSQPPATLKGTYWSESARPWPSLVFILPMMLVYELGVWKLGVRNGADMWMGKVLSAMGFSHLFLPLLTVAILLAWQHLTYHSWRFAPRILPNMAVESLMLAVVLTALLYAQRMVMLDIPAASPSIGDRCRAAVSYLGAGIYEELLFRLLLFSAVLWLMRRWLPQPRTSLLLAVLASSLLFSAAHYVGPAGDRFDGFTFTFRFVAGAFFAVLYRYRGFGIAAGGHALYDILVGALASP
jgi:membrane protease YdiL (CAAX protease family)